MPKEDPKVRRENIKNSPKIKEFFKILTHKRSSKSLKKQSTLKKTSRIRQRTTMELTTWR
jgi:hypothetical protein